jgi:cell division protease FtsH
MSERLGLVSYEQTRQSMFLPEGFSSGKNYSEAKAAEIDAEIAGLIEEAHLRVRKILMERRDILNRLPSLLSEQESVNGEELRKMLAPGVPGEVSSAGKAAR